MHRNSAHFGTTCRSFPFFKASLQADLWAAPILKMPQEPNF